MEEIWYVSFKWRDYFDDEQFEAKKFNSKFKAEKFYDKLKKETRWLIKKYGRHGVYHPFYEITIFKGE